MRSPKKTKLAYIFLLLIEIALYLLADIYFIGHLMILTVVYGSSRCVDSKAAAEQDQSTGQVRRPPVWQR